MYLLSYRPAEGFQMSDALDQSESRWATLETMMAEDSTGPTALAEVAAMDAAGDSLCAEISVVEQAAFQLPSSAQLPEAVSSSTGNCTSLCPELVCCSYCGRILIAGCFPAHVQGCAAAVTWTKAGISLPKSTQVSCAANFCLCPQCHQLPALPNASSRLRFHISTLFNCLFDVNRLKHILSQWMKMQ